jgi:RND superfamily putative drug exporter
LTRRRPRVNAIVVRAREDVSDDQDGHGASRLLARAIVFLRFLIVPAWIAATVLAAVNLPSIFDAESTELGSLLPSSSQALEVERRALDTFGLPLLSRTIAVATKESGFSPRDAEAAGKYIWAVDRRPWRKVKLRALPLTNVPGILESRRLGTVLLCYLYIDPALGEAETLDLANAFGEGLKTATGASSVDLTGAIPAKAAEANLVEEWQSWVEAATVAVVVLLLALYFRALAVPLIGLATVGIAYVLTDHVLGWLGPRLDLSVPREVDPVIVALLFGTLTDYLVFFVSGFRRRLEQGIEPRDAVRAVTGELLPVVATAAMMIAGATLALLLSGVRFLSAFGPGLAIAMVIGASVAMTFVPAVLGILGRAALWPAQKPRAESAREADRKPRGRLVGMAASHPLLVSILCIVALGAAASGVFQLRLGNPVITGLPSGSDPRQGYEAAADSLGPGVVGPSMLVLEGSGVGEREAELAALEAQLSGQAGIDGVLGPADEVPERRSGALIAPSGDAARFVLVPAADPEGAEATRIISGVEDRLPAMLASSGLRGVRTGITGDTSIAAELNDATRQAFVRIAPAAVAILLVLLFFLLRSWTAPLYLVSASVLVVAAALGLTAYFFQDALDYGEIVFFVPISTAIMLLALGSDYNVFLISRIWRQAEREHLRPAIRTAGSRAARAITVAGLILALSFGAVALIPVQGFRETAFTMFVGLVLDTLLARTLLIPALVSLFEPRRRDEMPGQAATEHERAAEAS